MVTVICKIYGYWILSETTSTVWTNRKLLGLHHCSSHLGGIHPWYVWGLLAAKEFLYDFLLFAAQTRDTFYWHPDCLTSVFLALPCLKVVTFVWGIEWVMRRKEAHTAALPLGYDFSKVAFLQIGPVVATDGKTDRINKKMWQRIDWLFGIIYHLRHISFSSSWNPGGQHRPNCDFKASVVDCYHH